MWSHIGVPLRSGFVFGILAFPSCLSDAQAQVHAALPITELSERVDELSAKSYLDPIDKEIGKIATQYRD